MLWLAGREPIQIRVDNDDRYNRIRAEITNFQEQELAEVDPAVPVISVGDAERVLNIDLPRPQAPIGYLRKIRGVLAAIR
jgi:hypothetical protein